MAPWRPVPPFSEALRSGLASTGPLMCVATEKKISSEEPTSGEEKALSPGASPGLAFPLSFLRRRDWRQAAKTWKALLCPIVWIGPGLIPPSVSWTSGAHIQ